MVVFIYFFCKNILKIPHMSWRRCKLYSIYRFVKITEASITIHTEFSKSLSLVSVQLKSTTFWKSSLNECVTVFRHTIIWYKQGCQRVQLDFSWRYVLLISIELSFHFGFCSYSSFVIRFPRFFKRLFRPMKILLLRHSQNNYQICHIN